jgi:putative NADPH-quinone reductase
MRWSSVVTVQHQKFHVSVMSQISWKAMKIRRNPKSWSGNKTPNRATIYIRKGLTPTNPSPVQSSMRASTRVLTNMLLRWSAWPAHAVIILTPTYWYQSPSPLKLMIDRMVCAGGGNPDPTTTHGKHVIEAKLIEQQGWDYPKHLAGRAYGVVVHGDVAGVESHRRNLEDWLERMGRVDAGAVAKLDRYVGYYEPYYCSHDALDKDKAVQDEVRNVASAAVATTKKLRTGQLDSDESHIQSPRSK